MTGWPRLAIEVMIRLVVIGVGLFLTWFGYINFLRGFASFRMPSMTPIASLYAAIPICGRADRAVRLRAAGQRLAQRLRGPPEERCPRKEPACHEHGPRPRHHDLLFLFLGYLGVPVAFSLTAGVVIGTAFTDVTFAAIVQKMFDGVDSEALLAIPFFLLVGELMSSANVVQRVINLSLTLVGHLKGGLSQVVAVFSMFFSEMSGSTTADVAVMSRTLGVSMKKEGYDPPFIAAIIASASTIAALVPPSITAVVYGAVGNVSIAGLFMAGFLPGFMIGIGLMIYCYFFGPIGIRRPRASFGQFADAAKRLGPAADDPGHPAGRHPDRLVHADRGRRGGGVLDPAGGDPAAEPPAHRATCRATSAMPA